MLVILFLIFFHVEYINNVDEPDDKYSNDQVYMSLRFLLIRINIIEVLSKSFVLFCSVFFKTTSKQRQRYFIPAKRLDTLQGYLAIANMGIAFAKNQIRSGLEYFADLDASFASLETSDHEVSDGDDDDDDDDDDDTEGEFSDTNSD